MFDRQGNRKYLNSAERKILLRVIKKEKDPLRRAFCLTLFHGGCRISEALNVTVGRFDVREKAVVFETLKRRKKGHFRSVPIPDDLVKLLCRIIKGHRPTSRIWKISRVTGYRIIKEKMAQARITGVMACPKGLRHGFAMACIERKIPLTTVKKWLGHARLETTEIYLDASGSEERKLAKRLWKN